MEKIARICWNTANWKHPSGPEGKSRGKDAYENIVGFGHEEWLLDTTKIMPDGYHYTFLQPINTKHRKHQGQIYDIHLITFNTIYRKKEYIGCLHNVECLNEEQAKAAYKYYKKVGWLRDMKNDIRFAGGIIKDMDADGLMFNIRFKFKDANINCSNRPVIADEDPNTQGLYYTLMDKKGDFVFEIDEEGNAMTLETNVFVRTTNSGEILIDPLHKKIQNALVEFLKDDYVHLYLEQSDSTLSSRQRIDVKGKFKATDEWHYFEIKTCSAKQSIREAFGQIMEYSHYDHISTRATKLFIVGPEKPDEKDSAYLKKLREMYHIPLWFRWYSFEDEKLYDEI